MFSRFGSGELALNLLPAVEGSALLVRTSNGGPDGSLVFAFAEYALLEMESSSSGPIRALWRWLLPACILGAEMYLAAYALHDRNGVVTRRGFAGTAPSPAPLLRRLAPRSRAALVGMYHDRPALASGDAEIATLCERYARMLRAGFHPIEAARPRQSGSTGRPAAPPPCPGARSVTFPQLPVSDLTPQPWW